MKINEETKIIFKPLIYNKMHKEHQFSKANPNSKEYIVKFNRHFTYNNLEPCIPPRYLHIKLSFFTFLQKENKNGNFSISLDSIILYEFKDNKYKLINDSEEYNSNNKNKQIYYNFNENRINIRVEFFSHKIDHFYFSLSEMCSIFLIKYLIYLKLKNIEEINHFKTIEIENEEKKNNIDANNNNNEKTIISNNNTYSKFIIKIKEIEKTIKLYGNGIINNSYQRYNNKNETNRNFIDDTILLNVLNYYLSFSKNNNSNQENKNYSYKIFSIQKAKEISITKNKMAIFNNNSEYTLSFIMTECKKDKLILGLDFRFNLLNYFSPYYTEQDNNQSEYLTKTKKFLNRSKIILFNGGGLKLFLYCLNSKCIYYSKYFVYHLGYGYFDIFNSLNNVSCPICKRKEKKLIEIKYIGMLNSKWVYKGTLSGPKYSNVEGQGITILNDIIYRTDEIIFSQQFISLYFQIEKYFSNNTIVKEDKQKKGNTINTTYFTDTSFNSNINEENEEKINNIYNNIPIKKIKNKLNRIKKKKVINRNKLYNMNYNKTSKHSRNLTTTINSSKCEINDFVVDNNNSSCWNNCTVENKNKDKDNCLIF